MPLLSALSILAFAALLWAAISIAAAVRRAKRRRQRRASPVVDPIPDATLPTPVLAPPRLRNFPTRLGKHPVAATGPESPSGWNPFGADTKDFADLTDPTPGGRRLPPRPRRDSRRNSPDRTDLTD